jgi:hypothetical protein
MSRSELYEWEPTPERQVLAEIFRALTGVEDTGLDVKHMNETELKISQPVRKLFYTVTYPRYAPTLTVHIWSYEPTDLIRDSPYNHHESKERSYLPLRADEQLVAEVAWNDINDTGALPFRTLEFHLDDEKTFQEKVLSITPEIQVVFPPRLPGYWLAALIRKQVREEHLTWRYHELVENYPGLRIISITEPHGTVHVHGERNGYMFTIYYSPEVVTLNVDLSAGASYRVATTRITGNNNPWRTSIENPSPMITVSDVGSLYTQLVNQLAERINELGPGVYAPRGFLA